MVPSKKRNVAAALLAVLVAGLLQFELSGKSGDSVIFSGMEMVLVPGSGTIPEFYMGKYEVTQKQFADVMGFNPSEFRNKPDNPVEMVSWYDAVEFCNRLSVMAGYKPCYKIDKKNMDPENGNDSDDKRWRVTVNIGADGFRLPASAEWEYAYRAGTSTEFYWGDSRDILDITQYAVYDENSENKGEESADYGPHKVGTKKPNSWQLHDMSGNVCEWCFEWSNSGFMYCRVLRGGGWCDNYEYLQSGTDSFNFPCDRFHDLGFRVARSK